MTMFVAIRLLGSLPSPRIRLCATRFGGQERGSPACAKLKLRFGEGRPGMTASVQIKRNPR